ncbi:diadenosine tetraphosphatase [Sorangium cellulosum]|uniref:Diaminobutyrate--2-oxoglutarate transaminase n=1 Tax=Sorangium cellulosum TaxID=56 RepID=A0A2L0ESQ4_SORCE|nr:diaminobutyrate--2-oxoglutarate transaminase [Sorangium cellulosum]AUX42314.1 diadenosine tetraphosphatase [Sorangium cellulosum]
MTIFESRESNVRLYCRSFPVVFSRARGSEVFDTAGKRYIDFLSGAGALNYGHNNETIKRRLVDYLSSDGIVHALDTHTVAKREFLEQFQQTILYPRQLDYKVQFCGPTGTNSVEAALKLARKVTGRTGVFAFTGAFHGMTLGSASISSGRQVRASTGIPLANTTFIPYEDGPRGPFDSLAYMERLLEDSCSGVDLPAAVFVETVQMDGGVYVASPEWLKGLRQLTQKHGILLACDDIQAGCGRAGSFFSFERAGITPDLVTLSKSISGYGFPMALLLMRPELDQWRPGEHTGTFRGNQMSIVGATAALDFWKDGAFESSIQKSGQLLSRILREQLAPGGAVRGIGMAYGIDLAQEGGYERARQVQARCFKQGLIIELCGRHDTVLKVLPPLTTGAAQLEEGCAILHEALRAG